MRGVGRSPRAWSLALAVAFAVLVVGPSGAVHAGSGQASDVGPEGSDATTDTSVGTTTSQFTWSSTVTGDFALRMVLDFPTLEPCTFHIKSAGRFGTSPVLQYTAHDEPGRGWTVLSRDHIFGTHASGILIRSNDAPYTHWAAHAQHDFQAYGEEAWLFSWFHLQGWNNPLTSGKSLVLDLSCSGPFTIIQIEGGKRPLAFTPDHMVGGAGATVGGPPASAPLLDVNVADFTVRQFSEPHIALRFRSDPFFGAGVLELSGAASERWMITGKAEVTYDGAAGRYQVAMTRAAAFGEAVGIIVGLQDVQSFDGAVGL